MQLIFFTKFLKGLSVRDTGERVRAAGFDGLDLAVRAGYCVNPQNAAETLQGAVAVWRDQGLTVPLVTLEGSATDPSAADTRAVYAACGAAGIPNIKLGYWGWQPGDHYWDRVSAIRDALAGFEELGRQHGVRSLLHTHSGHCYAVNASAAMHLAQGFDARSIGVYLDPAHLALAGEPWPMALDIARGYLAMVGVKNARHIRDDAGRWHTDWCLLSEGLVDWTETAKALREDGYDGPLTVHGEYSATEETDRVLPLVAKDLAHLRAALG